MAKKTLSYTESMAELDTILQQLKANSYTIDELKPALKRSAELITQCRNTLLEADVEIQTLLSQLESTN